MTCIWNEEGSRFVVMRKCKEKALWEGEKSLEYDDDDLQDMQSKCKGKIAEVLGGWGGKERKLKKRDRNDRIKDSWLGQLVATC